MGFIADTFAQEPATRGGEGEESRAVPKKAPPPSRGPDPDDAAVEAAAVVFLGKLKRLEGRHVRTYRDLGATDKAKLRRVMAECIRVYLRLAPAP